MRTSRVRRCTEHEGNNNSGGSSGSGTHHSASLSARRSGRHWTHRPFARARHRLCLSSLSLFRLKNRRAAAALSRCTIYNTRRRRRRGGGGLTGPAVESALHAGEDDDDEEEEGEVGSESVFWLRFVYAILIWISGSLRIIRAGLGCWWWWWWWWRW